MTKFNNYIIILLAFTSLCWTGCKELDLAPENTFTDLTYWDSEAKAQSVLNTAYSQMYGSSRFFYNEATSDNAFNGRGDTEGAASLAAGTYDPSLGRLQGEWNSNYTGIKTCNILLENIDRVPNMDEGNKARMMAEARFIRAFLHFQLMTWFGDVPLLSKDITIEEAQEVVRTPKAQVLEFILEELDQVSLTLPTQQDLTDSERGRITAGAAMALKARVHLYEGQWQEVVLATENLINGDAYGRYGLFPSYEGLFLPENEYSQEDILSLQYVPQFRTWGQFFDMAPLSAGARLNALAPTQELVDSYMTEEGLAIDHPDSGYDEENPYVNRDPRLSATVVYHEYEWEENGATRTIYIKPGSDPDSSAPDEYVPGSSSTTTGYYTRKYFDPTHLVQFASGLNLMLIRYADVLLMYAEAKNELGQLDESTWDLTIRALRERAGFDAATALQFTSGLGQEEYREIIRTERRVELAMEGLRIFDIRRWRIAEDVLNGWAHGAKFGPPSEDDGYLRVNLRSFDPSKHYLWPIPRDERNLNPNLTQNPGWN
ncbi:RagB/SusD family nutrient uptake outer membrane protein [Algoriphagus sp. AGSA1]|uniref:RagB/SusD family nutrient uptake outer membrane protein n=1 Tax=Algoriphagus sp. AGSA1 TaxID=2907213 RepID=UPI001F15D4CE|nr:RagB/SusD family nutrient uptake outer membrane protein [Algoriphagus sp. AGSA1]MCE7058161.1 RagB/SusD family nutrient uptake outer membrane protein [Algoriphagus sp. AGSA1]